MRIQGETHRISTGRQNHLSANPTDRIEDQRPLEIGRQSSFVAAIQNHIDLSSIR